MKVYCTNPNCRHPERDLTENLPINPEVKRYCEWCRTDLILKNRYLALEEIGSGGFGKTFRAYDFTFEQDCAVKILRPLQQLNPSELQSVERGFRQGAIILNSLNHQQIPRVYDYFNLPVSEHQIFFYLVQEYIPGQTLVQELANKTHRRFSEPEVVEILRSLLDIISYTHQQNVLHRDIKPSNIIHHRDNNKLYLIDFDGAIKRQLEPGVPVDQSRAMGTPGYAPPEQLSGRDIDISADLYAIAATCVCLLTGKEPAQICNTANLQLHKSWRIYVPNVEENLAHILDKMLSWEQTERYQSAKEVLEALSAISTSPDPVTLSPNPLPSPPPQTEPPTKPSPPITPSLHSPILERLRRILKWWHWISLGLLFFLGVAIAVFLHIINRPVPPTQLISAEYFSRGENALIARREETFAIQECTNAYNFKEKGIEAFKQASSLGSSADFQEAEKYFKQAIDEFKKAFDKSLPNNKCEVDPETWIYYYNSKAAQTASARSLPTIAVVIPSLPKDRGNALEILRGVVQVLSEQQEGAPVVQILIAKNNIEQIQEVKQVAQQLSEQKITGEFNYFNGSKILGVIGRYTSNNIWEAGDIYGSNKLVLIAPTSTAIRTPNPNSGKQNLNPYVFRTASNDSIAAEDLAKYMWDDLIKRKVMIVFKDGDTYSKSLKEEFRKKLINNQSANDQDIQYCDLTKDDPQTCINNARNQTVPVKALMLAPSIDTKTQAKDIVQLNSLLKNQKLQLLAGDVLYLDNLRQAYDGMVIAVSSHRSLAIEAFTEKAKDIWKTPDVSWRTLASYDAAKAFFQALTELKNQNNNYPSRQDLYIKLQSISAPGATTAKVEFDNKHDRKAVTGVGVLVQAKYDPDSNKCKLTHLKTPER